MEDNTEHLVCLLREFADGAKHGAINSEHVKFRVYTQRLLTALDGISREYSDTRLLTALLNAAASVASIHGGNAVFWEEHRCQHGESEPLVEDEHEGAQLREVGKYLVLDCIDRIFHRGSDVDADRQPSLFHTVLRAASLLRDLAGEPLTKDSWETETSIFWEYLVPISPPRWQRASQAQLLQLLLQNLADGLQFLPASEDLLCTLVERLTILFHGNGQAAEHEVYDLIISWFNTIFTTIPRHVVPNVFVNLLEAWLSRLMAHSTDPRDTWALEAAATAFGEAIVKALMDTREYSRALERLLGEHSSAESMNSFQTRSAIQCMLALKQQPWDWITCAAVGENSLQWSDIAQECIADCQRLRPCDQVNALKAHLGHLSEHLDNPKLVHVAHELVNQLLSGFPLLSDATELAEKWTMEHMACHQQEKHESSQRQILHNEKLAPVMIQHAERLRKEHLWSRAGRMFESIQTFGDPQQDGFKKSVVTARTNQCLLCWVATDGHLTKCDRDLIMQRAMGSYSKLQHGGDVMSICYWMITCLACRNELGVQNALHVMKNTAGISSEHVGCLEALALKQQMVCTAFNLRCLALNLQLRSPSVEDIQDTVSLGIKAIARSPMTSVNRKTCVSACHVHCHQLMAALAQGEPLPQPSTVVRKALASVCLVTVQSLKCSHLDTQDAMRLCCSLLSVCAAHPHVGSDSVFRVVKVVATVIDDTNKQNGEGNPRHLRSTADDLYRKAAAVVQSFVEIIIADDPGNPFPADLTFLTSFLLGRVLNFKNLMMDELDFTSLLHQIAECMQDQLCDILDCIERCTVDIQSRQADHKLQQLAVLAALMISWLASHAWSADLEITLCSCVYAFKEVLPLQRLTRLERAQIAMHLADVATVCYHHIHGHLSKAPHDVLVSVVACALAFPGAQSQIGQDACAELQKLLGARSVDHAGLFCQHRDHKQPDIYARNSSEPTFLGGNNRDWNWPHSYGQDDLPTNALVFL